MEVVMIACSAEIRKCTLIQCSKAKYNNSGDTRRLNLLMNISEPYKGKHKEPQ